MIKRIYHLTLNKFPDFRSDNFVIMPNHIHAIITIERADSRSARAISAFIQAFKSKSTFEYIKGVKSGEYPAFDKRIWQRNYYKHIIRNEIDYKTKWEYIDTNPFRWREDEYYR